MPDEKKPEGIVKEAILTPPPSQNAPSVTPTVQTPHSVQGHTVPGRPVGAAKPAGSGSGPSTAPKPLAKVPVRTVPMASLADRMADVMALDAKTPPASLRGGNTNELHAGHFHFMIYGEANSFKTSTAAQFRGPEHTLFIVTRRSEQLIPLARMGFHYVVCEDAESLRWALMYPERAAEYVAPEWGKKWATDPEATIIVDDVTEGTNVLKEDYMYTVNKDGDTVRIKDGRQAYKKAGDELHDILKLLLGRPRHVGLVAVDKNFDVEGTIDNRTEPDMPNKMMKLTETELEYVFFFPHGDKMQTQTSKVARQAQLEGKKETVVWNEITFAKCKLPLEYLTAGVVAPMEKKDLSEAWRKIQLALKGEWKVVSGKK